MRLYTALALILPHTSSHTLQAANVLLRSSESEARGVTAKIADFGLSFKMEDAVTHVSAMCCGTLPYLSPEALLEGRKSKASDV